MSRNPEQTPSSESEWNNIREQLTLAYDQIVEKKLNLSGSERLPIGKTMETYNTLMKVKPQAIEKMVNEAFFKGTTPEEFQKTIPEITKSLEDQIENIVSENEAKAA